MGCPPALCGHTEGVFAMRLQDKIVINNMRMEGHTPSVIAAKLGIPASTVRSFIHRNPVVPNTKQCLQ